MVGSTPGLVTFSIGSADSWFVGDNGLVASDIPELAEDLNTYAVPHLGLNHGNLTASSLSALAGAAHLRKLDFMGPWTNAELVHVSDITQLVRIGLNQTMVDDGVLPYLAGLSDLEELDISRTAVTGSALHELSGLSRLREILALESQFNDAGCANLNHVPTVRFLHLLGTPITNAGLGSVASKIPDLLELFVDRTSVDDGVLADLQSMSNLRTLSLESTGFTNSAVVALMSLSELIHFDVKFLPIDDATAQSIITSRTNWQTLNFENTTMTNAATSGLGQLPALINLSLRCSGMNSVMTVELSSAPSLIDLDLSKTQLDNSALPPLYPIKTLRYLNLIETGKQIDQDAVDMIKTEIPGLEVFTD